MRRTSSTAVASTFKYDGTKLTLAAAVSTNPVPLGSTATVTGNAADATSDLAIQFDVQ